MFQAVSPPIIRSIQLYIQLQVLSTVMIELNGLLINLYTNPPETCRASAKINKFKKRCILLAVIWIYTSITMHGHKNIKIKDRIDLV